MKVKKIIEEKLVLLYGICGEEIRIRVDFEYSYFRKYYNDIMCYRDLYEEFDDFFFMFSRVVNSSFLAYLLGIISVNPLKGHYLCDKCKYTEFNDNLIGLDLDDKLCPCCGELLGKDGFNIPLIEKEIDLCFDMYEKSSLIKYIDKDMTYKVLVLEERSGVIVNDFCDKKVLEMLFKDCYLKDDYKGVKELRNDFVIELLNIYKPKSFDELIKISGLAHGTDFYKNLSDLDLIGSREDIYETICGCVDFKKARDITFFIRNGEGFRSREMWNKKYKPLLVNLDSRYIDLFENIKYAYPKICSVLNILNTYKLLFYKIYYNNLYEELS